MNERTCPVCGFDDLERPVEDFLICDCCGTEFGVDDVDVRHAELRARWVAKGAPWFGTYYPKPEKWNPVLQMLRAGLHVPVLVDTSRLPAHKLSALVKGKGSFKVASPPNLQPVFIVDCRTKYMPAAKNNASYSAGKILVKA